MPEPSLLHLVEPARQALLAIASENIMQRSTPRSPLQLRASIDRAVAEAATQHGLDQLDTLNLMAFALAGVQVLASVLADLDSRVREVAAASAEREAGVKVQ